MTRNRPLTPEEVEERLLSVYQSLEEETENFESIVNTAARAEHAYKMAWSEAYLGIDSGTEKMKTAWADYKTEKQLQQHKIADAMMRAKQQKLNSLRYGIDMLRTVAANARASVN